ncbi:uncharacterized protein LOC116618796 isoform X2 [Nematostella vectensis]|uniref:uncharacterized protein LOC116618796 isoform X2 n=1 Tax=Nematostella vectensis TaxID=45351 RepID=UPI00207785EB|nr:uncharacterized protein LOC116618796 isoform X2 [Nematostella vectensis]
MDACSGFTKLSLISRPEVNKIRIGLTTAGCWTVFRQRRFSMENIDTIYSSVAIVDVESFHIGVGKVMKRRHFSRRRRHFIQENAPIKRNSRRRVILV